MEAEKRKINIKILTDLGTLEKAFSIIYELGFLDLLEGDYKSLLKILPQKKEKIKDLIHVITGGKLKNIDYIEYPIMRDILESFFYFYIKEWNQESIFQILDSNKQSSFSLNTSLESLEEAYAILDYLGLSFLLGGSEKKLEIKDTIIRMFVEKQFRKLLSVIVSDCIEKKNISAMLSSEIIFSFVSEIFQNIKSIKNTSYNKKNKIVNINPFSYYIYTGINTLNIQDSRKLKFANFVEYINIFFSEQKPTKSNNILSLLKG